MFIISLELCYSGWFPFLFFMNNFIDFYLNVITKFWRLFDERYCYIRPVKANMQLKWKLKYIIVLAIIPSDKFLYKVIEEKW